VGTKKKKEEKRKKRREKEKGGKREKKKKRKEKTTRTRGGLEINFICPFSTHFAFALDFSLVFPAAT